MNDKEKQIEEIKQVLIKTCKRCRPLEEDCMQSKYAEAIYNAGYRKLPKDSIVLTKEEYENLKNKPLFAVIKYDEDKMKKIAKEAAKNIVFEFTEKGKYEIRKETAIEILNDIFAPYNEIGGGLYELTPRDKKMLYKKYKVETENAELQKQVDKAKEQFLLTCENCHFKKDIELLKYQKEQAVKEFAERVKAHAERCYDWAVAKIVSAEVGNVLDDLLKEYEK